MVSEEERKFAHARGAEGGGLTFPPEKRRRSSTWLDDVVKKSSSFSDRIAMRSLPAPR